jgi:hypothetical protein
MLLQLEMPIFRFLKTTILTPALDSLYRNQQIKYLHKIWNQYKTEDFDNEKIALTLILETTVYYST